MLKEKKGLYMFQYIKNCWNCGFQRFFVPVKYPLCKLESYLIHKKMNGSR